MELKLKEGVDLSLLTTQHEIELMALELLDDNEYHTKSEIKLQVMIAVVAYYTQGDFFEVIGNKSGQELLDIIVNVIEPEYHKIEKTQDNFNNIINMIIEDINIYIERKFTYDNSVMGLLNSLVELFKNLEPEQKSDIINLTTNTVKRFQDAKTEEKAEETKVILSEKMNDLIQKYSKATK